MKKMSKDEQTGYLVGMINMLAHQVAIAGNKAKAECIRHWFYRDNQAKGLAKIFDTFDKFPDRSAEAIITVLVSRECGK